MPDKTEKARRKVLKDAQREETRQAIRQSLPASPAELKALFNYLDTQLESGECDNTLRHAHEYIRTHGLAAEAVVSWLEENGGYCDCEALVNAEPVIEDAVPDYQEL